LPSWPWLDDERVKKTERTSKPASQGSDAAGDLSLDEIKELIELVSQKQFTEFELVRGDFRLRLERGHGGSPEIEGAALTQPVAGAEPDGAKTAGEEPEVDDGLHYVTSPIVGTFYRASSPTAEPYVKLGDVVEAGATLCIVEAMKLMNEIPSDISGTIARIFAESGQPVEYGQRLFAIRS
jgi:acetyl-CoA carboxylase biotin carboxyl carrier protein